MSTTGRPMTVARMRTILDALDDTDLITDTDGVPLLDVHTDTGVLELAFAPRRRRAARNRC